MGNKVLFSVLWINEYAYKSTGIKSYYILCVCRYEGRFPAASPAAGNKQLHEQELDAFMSNICNPDFY